MPRGKKNQAPVEAAKDTAMETKAAAEQEAAKSVETVEVKPARRPGRPPKNAAAKAAVVNPVEEEAPKVTRKRASRTVKKVAEKAEKKIQEVKVPARAAKVVDAAVIIQFEGKNIETKNVAETAKERWIAAGNKASALKSVEVYINVTEGMAYPVINGEAQEGFSC
ncbi:MAG: hypothetical protein K2N63_04340 [Lachnospiraceae bacterium]|nr:hypothetical protein [Lachnospiraceae bacterium]